MGTFRKGILHGRGTKTLKNQYWEGNWIKGKMQGNGVHKSEKGVIYEGAFEDGLKHGSGTLKCVNGQVKTGRWFKDLKEGKFEVRGKTGKVKVEEYLDGVKISGEGKNEGDRQAKTKKKKTVSFGV